MRIEQDGMQPKSQKDAAANENITLNNTIDKTKNTVPTVYPDIEYVNRTLP